jgi:aldehyde dehydrogenase (NAD+)
MDHSAIRVVTGGPMETSHMLKFKFNHLFYTGGSNVGRIIAGAAAKHLTPVVLELGGQAPVIVGKTADIDLAAKRIAHAKITNGGQVCLNANHVFADPAIHDKLVDRMKYWFEKFNERGEQDFARIINERHFDRITGLLKATSGIVVTGGDVDRAKKYIQPTIVRDVTTDDSLLSEELFAPIIPVIVADVDRAIQLITSMPHPLGLYIFSRNQKEIDHILDSTTSGGVTINDCMLHAGVPNAPFGGVGESGYGSFHGKFGFDSFSHTRTVVSPPTWLESVMSFRYAPFKLENTKYLTVTSKLIGKPGETMEDQRAGDAGAFRKILKTGLLVAIILGAADSATGGKLLFVHMLKDLGTRFWPRT